MSVSIVQYGELVGVQFLRPGFASRSGWVPLQMSSRDPCWSPTEDGLRGILFVVVVKSSLV